MIGIFAVKKYFDDLLRHHPPKLPTGFYLSNDNADLGSFKLAPGKHTLRFEGVGRNPLAKGNYLGLDSVRLRERWTKKRKLLATG